MMNAGRAIILERAREYLGTPFLHEGRCKGVGVDCAGLAICVARELGLSSFDIKGYSRQPNPIEFRRHLREQMVEKAFAEAAPGDVVSFAFVKEQHIGIVSALEPFTLIHAWESAGQVVEHVVDRIWRARVRGCFAFPGVA